MPDRNKIIDQFFGDAATPIGWADEGEKRLHFRHDDLHCPQPIRLKAPLWAGTITHWSLHEEPHKGHWGWPEVYTRTREASRPSNGTISGLITDSGGALSHPAVVSREFGIPAVVGTGVAPQKIQTGQRVRVNGAAGLVEILAS